jgi:hypothetical protein
MASFAPLGPILSGGFFARSRNRLLECFSCPVGCHHSAKNTWPRLLPTACFPQKKRRWRRPLPRFARRTRRLQWCQPNIWTAWNKASSRRTPAVCASCQMPTGRVLKGRFLIGGPRPVGPTDAPSCLSSGGRTRPSQLRIISRLTMRPRPSPGWRKFERFAWYLRRTQRWASSSLPVDSESSGDTPSAATWSTTAQPPPRSRLSESSTAREMKTGFSETR